MTKYVINGGKELRGEIEISGGKNAAVAIIQASLLVDGVCHIENIPQISDVMLLLKIIESMGAEIKTVDSHTLDIDCTHIRTLYSPHELMRKIRASYYLIGAMLGRFGHAEATMPGGCDFGVRPIDQHIKGFTAMGAVVDVRNGLVFADVPGGRPRDGETPVSTFKYVPEVEEEDEPELKWEPIYSSFEEEVPAAAAEAEHKSNRRRRQRKPRQQHKEHGEQHSEAKPRTEAHKEKGEAQKSAKPQKKNQARAKTVKVEAKVQNAEGAKQAHKHRPAKDKPAAKNTGPAENSTPKEKGEGSARRNKRWNHYRGKGKGKGAAQNKAPQQ